jgi:hypothetical protein
MYIYSPNSQGSPTIHILWQYREPLTYFEKVGTQISHGWADTFWCGTTSITFKDHDKRYLYIVLIGHINVFEELHNDVTNTTIEKRIKFYKSGTYFSFDTLQEVQFSTYRPVPFSEADSAC